MRPAFDPTLILPIPPGHWPPPAAPVAVDGIALMPKPELHITLIGSALGQELRATFGQAVAAGMVTNAFDAGDWSFARTGRYLLLRKTDPAGIAHSLIELVDLPAMAAFHIALGRHLGRQLPIPPAHVTLYTADRDSGIGVSSPHRLRALTLRPVSAAELEAARVPTAG
ncbi:MAG TPA: hypothetical protein VFS82_03180 [Lysobacter sp.]|nr:hypothetical protein [Lysobacter sp.]